ncbi:MAG TPA: shikimate dehydrogenase [Candidatus Dormibacteraeota bacterium]|nr:shikimate dehydrogenase [Candidatus Dormibacteraeota bacterium]
MSVPKFCFVIHPVSLDDVARYEPSAKGKGAPIVRKILEWMPAWTAVHVTGVRTPDGRETEGWFVATGLLPEQMLELPREDVYARILSAIDLGVELGAQIAGLGAFTGVVGDGGVTIAQRAPIPVTTGNSLTIAAGLQSLLRGAREMGVEPAESTAVVVGATGSIGGACVRLLAPSVGRVILVARNATRLRKLHEQIAGELACPSEATTDVSAAVRRAQLVLTATSSTQDVIEPEDLQTGAIVCELSLPHDVSRRVAALRPDVLVTEGGNMLVPGEPRFERVREPGSEFDLNLPPRTALACMSETMVLALEQRFESYTLGRGIDLAKVIEMQAMAERCGFTLGGMRAFDAAITQEKIAATRAAARERRARVPV